MTDRITTTLIPRLCCRNASEAVEFYQKALGAESHGVFKSSDGLVMHAALEVEGVMFYITDEMPGHGALSPLSLNASPVSLYLRVRDCDVVYARAVAAGCKVQMPLQDMFWGDRYGQVVDPYGQKWEIATPIRNVRVDELENIMATMKACSEAPVAP
jgi:uncharacterized glyoxalase superfamily protein PhnB